MISGLGNLLAFLLLALFNRLFLQEAENVVKDEVAVGLLSKEESLDKFPPWLPTVGHLPNHLNNNTSIGRRLGIDRVNEDFAVLETDGGDFSVDFLRKEGQL